MDSHRFATCRIDFQKYPQNLPQQHLLSRKLKSYVEQLDRQAEDLFDNEYPSLDFLDQYYGLSDFKHTQADSLDTVRQQCLLGNSQDGSDSFKQLQCRFIFLYSRNSREALYTTRDMLMLALSYHLVQPWFLEFLFCFGEQEEPRDFRFSALRHISYLGSEKALHLPNLHRSGSEFHLCYNLKSVERSKGLFTWSIRQTVVYHIFDINTGQAFWLILKGNDSMMHDMKKTAGKRQWQHSQLNDSVRHAFRSSLGTHLSMCEWACENWRAYINYLEEQMNELTKSGLNHPVRTSNMPKSVSVPINSMLRKSSTWTTLKHKFSKLDKDGSMVSLHSIQDEESKMAGDDCPEDSSMPFEFASLQRVQFMAEKANEALYTIKNDIKIMRDLANFYQTLTPLPELLQDELPEFISTIGDVMNDLEMWVSTLETLVRVFNERKNLMFGILDYHNMQANLRFAAKAHISANRMEVLTEETKILTRKTKRETVSMKVIAGVTMFFLPGTFVSTLMSTDIVKWELDDHGNFVKLAAPGAAFLFLQLTLPLMFGTFIAWLFASWWYNSHDNS